MIPFLKNRQLLFGLSILWFVAFLIIPVHAQSNGTNGNGTNGNGNGRYVSIDFNDVDIEVFIKFISELTNKNFVIDRRVKGKVSVISPKKISIEEAYNTFESVLEVNGFATVKSGEIIKIVPAPDARTKSIATKLKAEATSPNDKVVTQLIPLNYADPEEIKKLFTPLISKNSVLLSYKPTNMLILTDVYSNIRRLLEILKEIDVTDIGRQLTVLPIVHADATKLVSQLETFFETRQRPVKGAALEKAVNMVADERTNTIWIMASESETKKFKDFIALIDKEAPKGSESIRVRYLEHANAEDLATVLQSLSAKTSGAAAGAKGKEPVVSGKVSITADKPTNSLIIMAEKDEYLIIEDVIKKLDIPRPMVFIECLIMEVNVEKNMNMGIEWIGGDNFENGNGTYAGGFSGGATPTGDAGYSSIPNASYLLPPGFSMGILSRTFKVDTALGEVSFPGIGAVIQAYGKDKDVNILSTPQIMTTDNEEATILVGKNVPYKTKSGTDTGSTSILYENFEYKDVGITLKITPQISKDRMVRLLINQEVSRLESTAVTSQPTTLKRTIDTTVIVKDKNTVVIGGLIDDSFSTIEHKTPCLGDIPLFGKLFQSSAEGREKTNLYVFLTPHVIENPEEATEIKKIKKEEIDRIKEGKINLYNDSQEQETGKTIP